MKYLILTTTLVFLACGAVDESGVSDVNPESLIESDTTTSSKSLVLQPEIRPEGINDLYSRLTVTDLKFFGALHLIPAAGMATVAAQSTAFKFELANGEAQTHTIGRALRVFGRGEYHVLMTIHPFDGGHSVDVAGSVQVPANDAAQNRKGCVNEAAPTTADEDEMEAAPTTADEDEMEAAPTTANEGEMEAAPTTANEGEMEAAPTTADDQSVSAAERQESVREVCLWESRYTGSSKFRTSSDDLYEFDLGTVSINDSDTHLILNWDMSDWMGLVMGEALGLSFLEMVALHHALSEMGTDDDEEGFTPDRVRLETN